jgi:hypothetical protein
MECLSRYYTGDPKAKNKFWYLLNLVALSRASTAIICNKLTIYFNSVNEFNYGGIAV